MHIHHEDNGSKGRFFIKEDDKTLAEMTYTWAGQERFIIDHTEVDDALRGKNAGKQLLMQAVAFAREKGVKILPVCPFAKAMFDRIPEINDVLYHH
jgi:predicted GNAT family acetyltransferase